MERRKFLTAVPYVVGGGLAVSSRDVASQSSSATNYVSVKSYGALGNGVADDTAAINEADLAATSMGATLHFPFGVYMVNNSGVTMNGCSWKGDGQYASIVKSLPQSYASQTGMVNAKNLLNFRISDMGFDISLGKFQAGSGNPGNIYWALQVIASSNWAVDHCAFLGIQAQTIALAVDCGTFFSIEDCYFYMPSPSNLYNQAINISVAAGAANRYNVSRNILINSGLFSNGAEGLVDGNYVTGVKFGAGLAFGPLSSCISHQIINNTCNYGAGEDINSTYPSGIECWSAYSIITGNVCSFNSGNGISVGNISAVVKGNICLSNGQSAGAMGAGIKMFSIPGFNASECIVEGNSCFDSQPTRTQLYGYTEAVVGGAAIYNNSISGNNFNNNKLGSTSTVGLTMDFRGPQLFVSTGAAPGAIGGGASLSASYTISGASFGDTVKVAFAADNQGIYIYGYVSALNTVTVVFANNSNSPKTLSSAALNIWVEKPAGYSGLN
jgi:hypothetical protein